MQYTQKKKFAFFNHLGRVLCRNHSAKKQFWNVSNNSQLDTFNIYTHLLVDTTFVWYRKNQNMLYAKFGLNHLSKYSLLSVYNIFSNILFVWPLTWKMWKAKKSAYPIFIFIQNFVEFRILDMEIQMKRAKCLILTSLLIWLPYSHRVSYKLTKNTTDVS